jgi:hypothetical protein
VTLPGNEGATRGAWRMTNPSQGQTQAILLEFLTFQFP